MLVAHEDAQEVTLTEDVTDGLLDSDRETVGEGVTELVTEDVTVSVLFADTDAVARSENIVFVHVTENEGLEVPLPEFDAKLLALEEREKKDAVCEAVAKAVRVELADTVL